MLFNGGVFRAPHLRDRVIEVLNGWLEEESFGAVDPLIGEDLMHAVARGAAYYGRARAGRGIRIRGGVPRTYYVGIETAMPAVPGMPPPLKALTVAPFGMEEGTSASIPSGEFGLITANRRSSASSLPPCARTTKPARCWRMSRRNWRNSRRCR